MKSKHSEINGMGNNPKVSVLTPVYNGEKYLAECIESVLSQTYENWEYVIVNNRSTDNSLEIAENYAKKDRRIRIHNNETHLPVLDNLNYAFRQMSPDCKYCKVIHSDDWMFPDCIDQMINVAEKYPTIGIVASYRLDDNKVNLDGLPYPSHYTPGRQICRDLLLNGNHYFGAPSNLLIRSDLIRKRKEIYNPGYLQSDTSACLDILQESDFGFVHQVLTFTRRHPETVTKTQVKKRSLFMLGMLKIMIDYGPVFLNEEEFEERHSVKLNLFYKQFARDIFAYRFSNVYSKLSKELNTLDLTVQKGKLLNYLFRELIRKFIQRLSS